MKIRAALTFILNILIFTTVVAQDASIPPTAENLPICSLRSEFYGLAFNHNPSEEKSFARKLEPVLQVHSLEKRKSPLLAGVLSITIPGAGEMYSESYVLAGIFLIAEAAGWYFKIDQTQKGNKATKVFEEYADEHWSVVKYAQWLNENAKNFKGGENTKPITINPDMNLPPWERVDWQEMNEVELAIPQFSHRLPLHGDQQYYELIGKYNQYSYGWADKTEGDYHQPSPGFLYYSGLRGKANDHYNLASALVNLIILNHVLSAVDAAWAAVRFNNNLDLHTRVHIRKLPSGDAELMPFASFCLRF